MGESDWALTAENQRQIREIVGANLRRERERAGLSQAVLAGMSGVLRETVARTESAKHEPKLATLLAFSHALHVPVATLIAGLPLP
jgi:transcriptional regulator with XRE-family HTH domain